MIEEYECQCGRCDLCNYGPHDEYIGTCDRCALTDTPVVCVGPNGGVFDICKNGCPDEQKPIKNIT